MRLIEKYGLRGIDKAEIDKLIAREKFVGLNRSPRAEEIIVSLTSYKPRINDVKYTLYSLLNQTFPPDKLILWLDEDSFPQREKNLPRDLLKLKSFGLTIAWCENIRSYKKLIPALEKYPDALIVTADDDIFYRPDWLKILYDAHAENPDCLVAHYAHKVRMTEHGNILPFKQWHLNISTATSLPPLFAYSFGSGGGVIIKKSFFHSDIMRREIFTELAPTADDLWFWAMAVLNGTKIKIPANSISFGSFVYVDIDAQENGENLRQKNYVEDQNDVQLQKIIERYPVLAEKIIREDAESKPFISVVIPIKDSGYIPVQLENIFWQSFPDFELIIVNAGARIEMPNIPTNFRVINYPGGSFMNAFNLGLQKATGDYVLFKDAHTSLPREALEIVAQAAAQRNADVIHFAGRIRRAEKKIILEDAPELQVKNPQLLIESRQVRADLWFRDKIGKQLDTKIFRRDFLLERKIKFDDTIREFVFRALVSAEKYLLVPQVIIGA